MTNVIYTNTNLEDEIKTIKALDAKLQELKELKEEKENLVKKVLDDAGVEELQVGTFTVRFTNVVRNGFNTSAFKKKYLELYNAFIKQSNYRKFTLLIILLMNLEISTLLYTGSANGTRLAGLERLDITSYLL